MSDPWSTIEIPDEGWVKNLRMIFRMTLRQLGKRLGITPQSVKEIELREVAGTVSLKSMRGIAEALGMRFIYAIVPESGTVDDIILARGRKLAAEIVSRARDNTFPESPGAEEELVEELAKKIVSRMPRYFWD